MLQSSTDDHRIDQMSSDRKPLLGYYASGQYVIVSDDQQKNELSLLGCYGQDLESARRKDDTRRGPFDVRLLDLVSEKDTDQSALVLTLHEAFFLAHALGCIEIRRKGSTEKLDIDTCWSAFRKYHIESSLKVDFSIEYAIYYYFRTRGWIVKPGDNYGTNFLLYRESPRIEHAHYAIQILDTVATENSSQSSWLSLLTSHRVIQSVCKELLLVYVIYPARNFDKPACIRDMKVSIKRFVCKTNLMI